MRFSTRPVVAALSTGTLLFTACSSGSDSAATATLPPVATTVDAESVDAESVAGFNDADVLFAQGMIPHHRDAVAMAEMALAPEAQAGADVRALATQIQGAQDPEIEQMTSMLGSWGHPLDMPGMDGMGGMEGVMSPEDMAALGALSGTEFDTSWALAMIAHHEGAVSMAQAVKASGSNTEVFALADAIIAGQQAEIDQMQVFIGS